MKKNSLLTDFQAKLRKFYKSCVTRNLDTLGHRSGRAQGLGHSITTFDKFAFGDRHVIYILRDRPRPRVSPPTEEEPNEEESTEPEPISLGKFSSFFVKSALGIRF